jgi:hypothetical protein
VTYYSKISRDSYQLELIGILILDSEDFSFNRHFEGRILLERERWFRDEQELIDIDRLINHRDVTLTDNSEHGGSVGTMLSGLFVR